jgi:hypothetical protein
MRLERHLEGHEQQRKRVERQAREIEKFRRAQRQIGTP